MTVQSASIPWKLESWQTTIATYLLRQQSPIQAQHSTHQFILALLWLYLCQQSGISIESSPDSSLESLQQGDRVYVRFLNLLEAVHSQLGLAELFPTLRSVALADTLLQDLLRGLYSQKVLPSPIANILGQVYEQMLGWCIDPSHSNPLVSAANIQKSNIKKSAGIYYTPAAIVQYILQSTLPHLLPGILPLQNLSCPRLLDPACGSGAFLLAAYQYLLDWYLQQYTANLQRYAVPDETGRAALQTNAQGQWRLTAAERERILLTHIYGVDVDPQAITVTKLCLWLMLLEDLPEPFNRSLPALDHNIRWGNALIGSDIAHEKPFSDRSAVHPFDWEPAFPEVFQDGGFDGVFGNPPYLDSEGMTVHLPAWRSYCAKHYQTAQGNWDLFCVFIEKAIGLCRPGGLTSLIVPNKLASARYASPARRILSQENQLLALRDYSRVPVFAASVYPLVYVAQKSIQAMPRREAVRCEIMQDLHQVKHDRFMPLSAKNPEAPWLLSTTRLQANLFVRLQETLPALGTMAQVTGAATVEEAYQIQAFIHDAPEASPEDLYVVNSGTIDRYCFLWGTKRMRYLGQTYLHPVVRGSDVSSLLPKRYRQSKQPKLIVAGMSRRLECALDETGAVLAGKSTSIIQVKNGAIDLRYLLGLLNSQLLSVFFNHWFAGNQLQGGYQRVGPPQLRQLPIYLPDRANPLDCQRYEQIIGLVNQRLRLKHPAPTHLTQKAIELNQKMIEIDSAIDRLVCQLYQLTDEEIQFTHEQ